MSVTQLLLWSYFGATSEGGTIFSLVFMFRNVMKWSQVGTKMVPIADSEPFPKIVVPGMEL